MMPRYRVRESKKLPWHHSVSVFLVSCCHWQLSMHNMLLMIENCWRWWWWLLRTMTIEVTGRPPITSQSLPEDRRLPQSDNHPCPLNVHTIDTFALSYTIGTSTTIDPTALHCTLCTERPVHWYITMITPAMRDTITPPLTCQWSRGSKRCLTSQFWVPAFRICPG